MSVETCKRMTSLRNNILLEKIITHKIFRRFLFLQITPTDIEISIKEKITPFCPRSS